MKYFEVNIMNKEKGFNLTRDNYPPISKKKSFGKDYLYINCLNKGKNSVSLEKYREIYEDEEGLIYTDAYSQKYLEEALKNFDLNMNYFERLNHLEFQNILNSFLKKHHYFTEVKNLNHLENIKGHYIIILDRYCQAYIGTSGNIKKRIMQHWTKQVPIDRLVYGSVENSILSIDSFRAFDTSRIFAYCTPNTFAGEEEFINDFDSRFLANRTAGGRLEGLQEANLRRKTRLL